MNLVSRARQSSLYPVAIQATVERLIPHPCGVLPSDERDLATMAGWNSYAFKHNFLLLELLLLGLIVLSLFWDKVGVKQSILIASIALASSIVSAGIGICVVERFVFPAQFKNSIRMKEPKPGQPLSGEGTAASFPPSAKQKPLNAVHASSLLPASPLCLEIP